MLKVSEVVKIRRRILSELARLTMSGELKEKISSILTTVVTDEGPRYRCCVHKERAVVKDRIIRALGQSAADLSLETAAENALNGKIADTPILGVIPNACDQCPIDKFFVTNACRNCIAHNCIASCPRQAIMIIHNHAYIDKTKCVECGMCKKSCSYGAIIEVNRPCEGACELGAITAGSDRRAAIDYDKCVQCGLCKIACPFGAISDRTAVVQLLQQIKNGRKVHALLAPAFVGQFGAKIHPGQVVSALIKLGFYDVQEVSVGADIVSLEETREFIELVPETKAFMTTSCCPAFANMVEKHLPQIASHVSTAVSPMIAAGKMIKEQDPYAIVVFIGPCIAKKVEAEQNREVIDYVVTFEEIECILNGVGIGLEEMGEGEFSTKASRDGNAFARAGGVVQAVVDVAANIDSNISIKAHHAEGLGNCKAALLQLKAGKIDANFFEGMACIGGCVGGPGKLADPRVTGKLVENFAAKADIVNPSDNEAIKDVIASQGWHKK